MMSGVLSSGAFATGVLTGLLTVIAFVDIRHFRIPDGLNLVLLTGGLVVGGFRHDRSIAWCLSSAFLAALAFWLVRFTYARWRGRQGLGLGDVKFAGAGGAWIGIEGVPTMMLWASLAALLVVCLSHLGSKPLTRHSKLPFGPFLALGLLLVWFFGPIDPIDLARSIAP